MDTDSIDSLIRQAQENPEQLMGRAESLVAEIFEEHATIKFYADASERLSKEWKNFSELRGAVDALMASARKLYKEVLKKTESAALQGNPRLYWAAKSLFSQLRKNSLNYQIKEASMKADALRVARADLQALLQRFQINMTLESTSLVAERSVAEARSKKHAVDLQIAWEKVESCIMQNRELREKIDRLEVQETMRGAVVNEGAYVASLQQRGRQVRTIDSPRMLTSKSPYVGFSNRPRLASIIEQGEYAAQHAEQDLEKVREGLRLAKAGAIGGRATSVSLEWLEYCKIIVARYEQLAGLR